MVPVGAGIPGYSVASKRSRRKESSESPNFCVTHRLQTVIGRRSVIHESTREEGGRCRGFQNPADETGAETQAQPKQDQYEVESGTDPEKPPGFGQGNLHRLIVLRRYGFTGCTEGLQMSGAEEKPCAGNRNERASLRGGAGTRAGEPGFHIHLVRFWAQERPGKEVVRSFPASVSASLRISPIRSRPLCQKPGSIRSI